MADQYPDHDGEYKFLNSGGFIGYANQIMTLIDDDVDITYDDQLYYTEKFLETIQDDEEFIKLDYEQNIFQTLNQAITDVEQNDNGRFINLVYKTKPCVIHANGPSWVKKFLKEKSLYMFGEYDGSMGSINMISKTFLPTNKKIYIGLFLQHGIEDINQVFDHIRYLSYPKKNIQLHIVYDNEYDLYRIDKFVQKFGEQYQDIFVTRNEKVLESRKMVLLSSQGKCDFVMLMDSNHIFRNMKALELLVEKDLDILTPMILEEQSNWVNFSFEPEYMMINAKTYKTKNIFVTDFAYGVYFIKNSFTANALKCLEFDKEIKDEDWDTEFCKKLGQNNFKIYICNQNYYGGIIK
jgi:procollagen-lysine,2-oxoglutarate 5-dioxygenase